MNLTWDEWREANDKAVARTMDGRMKSLLAKYAGGNDVHIPFDTGGFTKEMIHRHPQHSIVVYEWHLDGIYWMVQVLDYVAVIQSGHSGFLVPNRNDLDALLARLALEGH